MTSFPTVLRNHVGERLDFSLHRSTSATAPVVILGHGVTGHKDRPILIAIAEELATRGITALRVSFAGNGASEGRFEDCTISKEVQELGAVIDQLDAPTIGYIGHSMGSAVGVRRASSDPRINFLVSVSGIAHTAAFAERHFGDLKPGVDTMWEKPGCVYSRAYLEDMRQIGTIVPAAQNIRVPWLFVHGTADDVVPLSDSRDLFEKATAPKHFETIADADHVFSAHTSELVRVVVPWIAKLKLSPE